MTNEQESGRWRVRAGPDGIHLFNRATGVNLLIDEAGVPEELWAAAPRYVSVALTNACDLHCPYCYAPKHSASLSSEILIGWFDELDANGCLGIGFGGGEPTLYRELPALCQHLASRTGLAATLTTHAHHFDDELAAQLKGNVHFIRVSMDGVGATYEKLRGRPFSELCRRFNVVREVAPFGINFVINAHTLPDLDAGISLATDVGATAFLLIPEQPVRRRKGVDTLTMRALRSWVDSYRGTMPISMSESGSEGFPACDPFVQEAGLRAYVHIDASGVLKRSSYAQNGILIGERRILDAIKILDTERADI